MFTTVPVNGGAGAAEKRHKNIRVVLADDHPIVRQSLKRLLAREDDLQVVGEAGDGREVLSRVEELAPDILLLDLGMPNGDGLTVLKHLQCSNCTTKVILFTASEDKNEFVQAMRLGCLGIVQKQAPPELLVKSIRKVYAGEIWLDFEITGTVMRQFSATSNGAVSEKNNAAARSVLSRREHQVVALVARGYKNKELATELLISEQTAKNHLHNIFGKLGISDRLELALYAIHKGWHLSIEP